MVTTNNKEKKGEKTISQSEFPRYSLKEALTLAESLRDNFAGKDATPIDLANSIQRSPTGSGWRVLTSSGVAYGLTAGTFNASMISLTPLGSRIVNPTEEGADRAGLIEALLKPTIMKAIYEKYDGAKFPKDDIARNVLRQYGIPNDRLGEAYEILIDNAKFVGIMTEAQGNQFIQLRATKSTLTQAAPAATENQVRSMGMMPQPYSPSRENDFHIPIIEEKMYIELPEAVYKRSLLDDEVNDDLRALIKQAHAFAQKHISKPDTGDAGNSG